MHWVIIAIALLIIATNIYRLATGGIAVYGFWPIMWLVAGVGLAYVGWSMRPVAPPPPMATPLAGGRRRGGRYRW